MRCQFQDGKHIIGAVAPMPYTLEMIDKGEYQWIWYSSCLVDIGGILPGRQGMRIEQGYGNEQQLIVARVESSGEWVIVTHGCWGISMFASCEDEGELEYENSVFQRRDETRRRELESYL